MIAKHAFPAAMAVFLISLLSSCSMTRPVASNPVSRSNENTVKKADKQPRFLEEISATPASPGGKTEVRAEKTTTRPRQESDISLYMNRGTNVEKASALQFKYAVLLNTEVEELTDTRLLG